MKVAIITYKTFRKGSQIKDNVLTEWATKDQEQIEFEFKPEKDISDVVAALQQHNQKHPVYCYGNTFEWRYSFNVEILD